MDIRLELITGRDINFNGVKIIQKSISEILDLGMDNYNKLLFPFILDIENFNIPKFIGDFSVFDILVLDSNIEILLNSLKFFCNADKIQFDEHIKRIYIHDGYLDRSNFEEFSKIILEISGKVKPEREKQPVFKSQKHQDIWDKIQKGRKRIAEQNKVELCDMINVCEFSGDYHIPISEIMDWSLWRIANCYKNILEKQSYRDSFEIFLISGDKSIIENKHWLDRVKIKQENK